MMTLDIEAIDAPVIGLYDTLDDTPLWVQERIATLMLVDPTPPTEEVTGVGHRIDRDTYWIHSE